MVLLAGISVTVFLVLGNSALHFCIDDRRRGTLSAGQDWASRDREQMMEFHQRFTNYTMERSMESPPPLVVMIGRENNKKKIARDRLTDRAKSSSHNFRPTGGAFLELPASHQLLQLTINQ
jgi:hypothetical protein